MANLVPFDTVRVKVGGSRVRFRLWVGRYGHSRLARSLNTRREVVHGWTMESRLRNIDIRNVRQIIALSRDFPLPDGPLSYEDILGEVEVVERVTHIPLPPVPACVRHRREAGAR